MPDLIGLKLEDGLQYLQEENLPYRLVEYHLSKSNPSDFVKRIIRQRWLTSGEIEIVYSVDTYQLG